ncbi:MAG: response regulator [Candidatus Rokubacteria bacterium]|nr:response regulator [Candidatus Rokubacteria bacterium]
MRILVVDDEPIVAGLIAEGLRNEGYGDVVIANSGEQGLQVIEGDPPDVVFLDITMPGMDGIEVLRRIRERSPDLPVIILSGWGTDRQLEAARQLGVTDVLQKPTPLKNLSQTLVRLQQITGTTPPYLIVVARNQPYVFESLNRRLAGDPEFQVLLDRRQGERRQRPQSHEPDRRRADRRLPAAEFLRFQGIGIIRRRQTAFARPR